MVHVPARAEGEDSSTPCSLCSAPRGWSLVIVGEPLLRYGGLCSRGGHAVGQAPDAGDWALLRVGGEDGWPWPLRRRPELRRVGGRRLSGLRVREGSVFGGEGWWVGDACAGHGSSRLRGRGLDTRPVSGLCLLPGVRVAPWPALSGRDLSSCWCRRRGVRRAAALVRRLASGVCEGVEPGGEVRASCGQVRAKGERNAAHVDAAEALFGDIAGRFRINSGDS